ncbi:uncharacterized protein LOC117120343 [Anneissia japonica]|uniref:uncharacterized protein LOC117120343 n=1 Tax=Anneissia japonica TaxID=1529436 RepID=UPI001425B8FB|nr:uncharacterized protein LOC117120343 [Anneissia japonica]
MKIYICGSKESGKTTLYKTLLRSKLRSRITVERYLSYVWPPIYNFFQIKTIAIDIVEKDYIPGVKGFFSFREFSSKAPYFLINATFTHGNFPVIFVVYDLSEDENECQNKLLHWLNQIKASSNRESVESQLENILIIATHADSPTVNDVSREAAQDKASRILDYCKDNFSDVLNMVGERPFLVDARFGRDEGFEEIKDALKMLKSTLQCPITMDRNMLAAEDNSHQVLHRICDKIIRAKRTWIRPVPAINRRDTLCNPKFPVLKWEEYERKVLAAVKGVGREDVKTSLKSVTNILNDWDEVIFVEREQCFDSLIVLKPEWLTSKLLVPLFFEEANSKYLIPVSDAYEKLELKSIIRRKGWNDFQTDVIMELAEHFGLLFPCDGDDKVILPTRLPDESLTTQTFVSGVSYELQNETDILLPTFFPKLQFKLKNKYKRITQLFRSGGRINDADVTGHVQFLENRKIFVLSNDHPGRKNVEAQHLKIVNEISKCIEEAVGECCRGRAVRLTKKYFDRSQLLGRAIGTIASLDDIPSYTVQQLIQAELETNGKVVCAGHAARVLDVLMEGHDFTIIKELGLVCNVVWLPDEIYNGAGGLEVLFREFNLRDGNAKLLLIDKLGLNGTDSKRDVKSLVREWAAKDYKKNSIGTFCKMLVEMHRPDAVSEIKSVLTRVLEQDIFQRIYPDKEDWTSFDIV